MIAEILSTGDEVCSGAVVDSNAAFIAERLLSSGLQVTRHTCVGDCADRLTAVMKEIGNRADIAVVTGGLGPTIDDITAQAAADAAGVGLAENRVAMQYVSAFFAKFNRKMTDSDAKQARLPVDAVPIINPNGTAPGFSIRIGKCACFFLPGVPHEMRHMMTQSVLPQIKELRMAREKQSFFLERQISVFGLPEAMVNEKIAGLTSEFPDVKFGMIARFPVIYVKLTAFSADQKQMADRISAAAERVRERIGERIFSMSGQSMEAVVGELLKANSRTVATAESCTGGLVAHRLTNISGSSDYFLLSAVTYANSAKINVLGVSEDILSAFGAVHEETVKAMAEGVRKLAGADYGLATSGIAGPTGGTEEKPVGTVCIGVATPKRTIGRRFAYPFRNRLANKELFAETALDVLRRELVDAAS